MTEATFLLFDAGGTLVFPDERYLCSLLSEIGVACTPDRVRRAYYQVIYDFDYVLREHGQGDRDPWPENGYVQAILTQLEVAPESIAPVAEAWDAKHSARNLWAYTRPGVGDALAMLRGMGYRMAVFSNSDGRTDQVFRDTCLNFYFEAIFDSTGMGLRKPVPAAFLYVVDQLGLSPQATLYIGDIYHTDVCGAQAAGLGAIHIDPFDLYVGWPGIHIHGVCELPVWLQQHGPGLPAACFQSPPIPNAVGARPHTLEE